MARQLGRKLTLDIVSPTSKTVRVSFEPLERRMLLSAELVRDVLPPSSPSLDDYNPNTSPVVKAGDSAYFATSHYPKGRLLWKTDGGPDGTSLVADFTEFPAEKPIEFFVEHNDLTYFLFDDALWQTNGLPGGTSIVQADFSARYFTEPRNLVGFKGAIYFTDGGLGGEGRLWRSDGTASGLQRVFPVKAKDATKSVIGKPVAIGDALVFQLVTEGRVEVWRTDGTAAGTYPLIDHDDSVGEASAGSPFYYMNGSLYVLYWDGDQSLLYRTDGTRAGTEAVRSLGERPSGAVVDGGMLYFGTFSGSTSTLWRSDGTGEGTTPIKTFKTGQAPITIVDGLRPSSYFDISGSVTVIDTSTNSGTDEPAPLTNFHLAGGTAVFTAEVDGVRQLFRTDGTDVGTRQITDFYSSNRDYDPIRGFTNVGETLYFTVTHSPQDAGTLYATDGSVGGTRRLWDNGTDPNLYDHYDPQQGQIQHLSAVDGMLYFTGYLPKTGKDVLRWKATGSIAGVIFNDVDYDGLRQDNEIGLRGWKVFLDKNRDGDRDAGEPFVRTNSAGRYRFHSLPPGTYTIGVVPEKEGWLSTMPAAKWSNTVPVVSGRTSKLNLSTTQVDQTPGSIAGTIFSDRSSIDLPPTFPSRASNLRVFVDLDRDGHWDSATEPSDVSDSKGSYRIDELTAGRYPLVLEIGGSPYSPFPSDFAADIPDVSTNRFVSVLPGRQNASNFWLHFDPAESSIKGRVFNDKDVDGSPAASEAGFAGQKLYLDRNFDHKLSPGEPVATTDAEGTYIFSGLTRGYYSVRLVSLPIGDWTTTTQNAGGADLDYYDQDAIHFGFAPDRAGTISGFVYYDKNANGKRDKDEPGIGSRSVTLEQSGASVQAFTTQSDGRFTFDVDSGSYTLRSIGTPGADWDPSSPTSQSIFVLPSRSTSIDFGFKYNPNSILRGTVFDDRDRNRIQGASEGVVEGIEVYLDYNRNNRRDADEPLNTSDSDGIYEFKNLRAGSYHVRILNLDWDFLITDIATGIAVSHDQQRVLDLNLRRYSGVRGYAFLDDDRDKWFDENETLIAGVRIYIDENEDGEFNFGERSVVSNSITKFSMFGTSLGKFTVGVIAPDGYTTSLRSIAVDLSTSDFKRIDIHLRRE